MKKSLIFWQVLGFIFTGAAGVLLHFLYDLTDQSIIIAPFAAVNESIWEHMKILFFPMLILAIFEYIIIGKKYKNFWCVKLIGIIVGILLIPALYYTYTGAFGINIDWINILIFFVSVASVYYIETRLFRKVKPFFDSPITAFSIIILIINFFL